MTRSRCRTGTTYGDGRLSAQRVCAARAQQRAQQRREKSATRNQRQSEANSRIIPVRQGQIPRKLSQLSKGQKPYKADCQSSALPAELRPRVFVSPGYRFATASSGALAGAHVSGMSALHCGSHRQPWGKVHGSDEYRCGGRWGSLADASMGTARRRAGELARGLPRIGCGLNRSSQRRWRTPLMVSSSRGSVEVSC